jgi:hypothetical protein
VKPHVPKARVRLLESFIDAVLLRLDGGTLSREEAFVELCEALTPLLSDKTTSADALMSASLDRLLHVRASSISRRTDQSSSAFVPSEAYNEGS